MYDIFSNILIRAAADTQSATQRIWGITANMKALEIKEFLEEYTQFHLTNGDLGTFLPTQLKLMKRWINLPQSLNSGG